MNVIEFKRDKQGLIIVWGTLEGPLGERDVKLILDTGAAMTLILPEVLDELGYSARDGENISRISTAALHASRGGTPAANHIASCSCIVLLHLHFGDMYDAKIDNYVRNCNGILCLYPNVDCGSRKDERPLFVLGGDCSILECEARCGGDRLS